MIYDSEAQRRVGLPKIRKVYSLRGYGQQRRQKWAESAMIGTLETKCNTTGENVPDIHDSPHQIKGDIMIFSLICI